MANTPNAPFASGDPGQTMHQGEEIPHAQTDYDPLEFQLESMYEMALDEDEEDIGGILLVLEDVTLDYVVGVPCPISARSRSYEVTDIRNDPDALQRD